MIYVMDFVLLTYHSISNVPELQLFMFLSLNVDWWIRNKWKNAHVVANSRQMFEMFYTGEAALPCDFPRCI